MLRLTDIVVPRGVVLQARTQNDVIMDGGEGPLEVLHVGPDAGPMPLHGDVALVVGLAHPSATPASPISSSIPMSFVRSGWKVSLRVNFRLVSWAPRTISKQRPLAPYW